MEPNQDLEEASEHEDDEDSGSESTPYESGNSDNTSK